MSSDNIQRLIQSIETADFDSKSVYESWSQEYLENHSEYYRGVLEKVQNNLTGPILDVGAAPFHLTYLMREAGYDTMALDLDPDRMSGIIQSLDISVKKCDIEREQFPFEDNSFSGVVFTEVLEHLRINPIWTLREISRILKPNGKILLTTPNLTSMYNIHSFLTEGKIIDPYDQFIKLDELGHMGHVREYTSAEVRSLLEKTGFNTTETEFAN